MYLYIFCHLSMRLLDGHHLLSCACQSNPSRGWWQVVFDPLLYLLLCPACLASDHVCVYFYKVRDPKHYPFRNKIFRDLLSSRWFPLNCFVYNLFRGGSKIFGKPDEKPTWNCLNILPDLLDGLCYCCLVSVSTQLLLPDRVLVG